MKCLALLPHAAPATAPEKQSVRFEDKEGKSLTLAASSLLAFGRRNRLSILGAISYSL
jgi:hypothetical protein